MVDFEKRCSYLEAELKRITSAYDILNSEHSMMLEVSFEYLEKSINQLKEFWETKLKK